MLYSRFLVKSLSCVQLLATPWTVAYQAPLSMGFPRQEYWSGLPFPSPHSRFLLAIYLDRLVCIFQPQSLSVPLPFHLSLLVTLSLFATCVILFLLCSSSSSVAQSCPTLCNPMNLRTTGLPVHHQFPEYTQTRVH